MQEHLSFASNLVPTLIFLTGWFAIGLLLFGVLHWMFKDVKQPFWRRDMKVDITYWFLGSLLYAYVGFLAHGYAVEYGHVDSILSKATGFLKNQPILAQAILVLLITDLCQYWAHRLFHHNPLWRFHCIHHAPTSVDWLSSARMHPVNYILYITLINLVVGLLGFAPKAFIILVPFNVLFGFLVHANLNWTFGPLRYVLASPVFHRWHHTIAEQGGNRNFAPTFAFLDLAFGTFHMPAKQTPSVFGIEDLPVPQHLLGQLCFPFVRHVSKDTSTA